jgi:hypothetical protein
MSEVLFYADKETDFMGDIEEYGHLNRDIELMRGEGKRHTVPISRMCAIEKTGFNIFLCLRCCSPG